MKKGIKNMNAYQFYYQMESYSPAEYIRVIASSQKEATQLFDDFVKNVVGDCYFSSLCIWVIKENRFLLHNHEIGDILGGDATI